MDAQREGPELSPSHSYPVLMGYTIYTSGGKNDPGHSYPGVSNKHWPKSNSVIHRIFSFKYNDI